MLRVLVLEDDEDLRNILGELLSVVGADVRVRAASLAGLQDQRVEALGCGLALLDINLGAGVPSGLEAYQWLRDNGFSGRTVFLTGHARSHPLVRKALELPHVQVLSKPIDAQVLLSLVEGGAYGTGTP